MRVIGAKFSDRGVAERALADLRRTFGVGPNEASLAQLGSSSDRGDLTLLAGHFPDERVQEVRQSIVSFGGKIVTDVDEAATRSRTTPVPPSAEEHASEPPGGQEASAVGAGGGGSKRQEYFAR
jgi:hypothetical protein